MATPRDILERWIQAVNSGDVEGLLALYDPQAVLIPTFSNRFLKTPEELRGYFEKLASREALHITLHENTLTVQPFENDKVVVSGIYTWRFLIDGVLLHFEARFSYVMDLTQSRPILHHHSSQIPRAL